MAGKATIRLLTFSTGFAICRAGRFKGSWCTLLIGRLISPIIKQLRDEFKILLFTSLCYSFYSRNFLSSALLLIYLSLKFPFFWHPYRLPVFIPTNFFPSAPPPISFFYCRSFLHSWYLYFIFLLLRFLFYCSYTVLYIAGILFLRSYTTFFLLLQLFLTSSHCFLVPPEYFFLTPPRYATLLLNF